MGGVAGRRSEFDARGGISAAHLDAEVRGKRQFGAARHAAVAIAIALAAAEGRGDRRNAVGGEALTAEAPAQQSRAAADRGARADRVARTGPDVEAALQRTFRHSKDHKNGSAPGRERV